MEDEKTRQGKDHHERLGKTLCCGPPTGHCHRLCAPESRQLEGVLTTEGPLLLLAGAGSGKTTVLINRVANLLRYGRGSDTEEIPLPISQDEVEFLEQYATRPGPGAAAR